MMTFGLKRQLDSIRLRAIIAGVEYLDGDSREEWVDRQPFLQRWLLRIFGLRDSDDDMIQGKLW